MTLTRIDAGVPTPFRSVSNLVVGSRTGGRLPHRRRSCRGLRPMMQRGGSEEEAVLSLLNDEYARTIIVKTYREPSSASALSTACDADPSTVYRRIGRLEDSGLLDAQQRLDPEGHHYKEYTARLEHVGVNVTTDGLDVDVEYVEREAADTFTRLYEEFSG